MLPSQFSHLIERLIRLRQQTDPQWGNATASSKDIHAFTALRFANALVEGLAGWAIEHQVGLALDGRKFVGFAPHDHLAHPEYMEKRAEADDHRHELAGREPNGLDPVVARKLMINLRANPGGFPEQITRMMIEALEALDYNEVLPILEPMKESRKVGFREQRISLRAIGLIHYRVARGTKKYRAIEDVANAFAVSPHTMKSWEHRLRQELGQLEVARTISSAKALAEQETAATRGDELYAPMLGMGDELYGHAALLRLAREYKKARGQG